MVYLPNEPPNKVEIREETPGRETGGHFGSVTLSFNAPPGISQQTFIPKIPVALLQIGLLTKECNPKDRIRVYTRSNYNIGKPSAAVSAGDTVIYMDTSKFDTGEAFIGLMLKIQEGPTENDLGIILERYNDRIVVDKPPSVGFTTAANLLSTISFTPPVFGYGWVETGNAAIELVSGASKIGASRIEAGQDITIEYDNTGTVDHDVRLRIEFLY